MSSTYGLLDALGMQGAEDLLLTFLGIYLAVLLFLTILSIVTYIFYSIGLYSIAKRRGIHHPWLAWIPIAKVWTLGSVSDQYQYVVKKKVTNRRKTLLCLYIVLEVISWCLLAVAGKVAMEAVDLVFSGSDITTQLLSSLIVVYVLDLVLIIVGVVSIVFAHIANYDLFVSSKPGSAVTFLVLSIIFSWLAPFFVFACRKKDDGMSVPQVPVQQEFISAPEETDFEPEE